MAKLGSPKASHTAAGQIAVKKIEREADSVVSLSKEGRCTAAYLAYAEMKRAEGAAEAHMHAGGKVWIPFTSLKEAGGAFSDHCVRITGVANALDGADTTKPPPVYHDRKGPPPGVPILPGMKGRTRRRR